LSRRRGGRGPACSSVSAEAPAGAPPVDGGLPLVDGGPPVTAGRTCVRPMIVCVLLPRFELVVATAGREELLGAPVALAPEPCHEARGGEDSPAREEPGGRAG